MIALKAVEKMSSYLYLHKLDGLKHIFKEWDETGRRCALDCFYDHYTYKAIKPYFKIFVYMDGSSIIYNGETFTVNDEAVLLPMDAIPHDLPVWLSMESKGYPKGFFQLAMYTGKEWRLLRKSSFKMTLSEQNNLLGWFPVLDPTTTDLIKR